MRQQATPELLIDQAEAARLLGISARTLRRNTAPAGSIPCVRFARAVRYSPEALRCWIAEQQTTTTKAHK